MSEEKVIVLFILISLGSFCAGILVMLSRVMFWRIQWIIVEHQLARLLGREPRRPDDLKP